VGNRVYHGVVPGGYVTLDGKERGRLPIVIPKNSDGSAGHFFGEAVSGDGQWMVYQVAMKNGDTLGFIYDSRAKGTIERGKVHGRAPLLQLSTTGDSYNAFLGSEFFYSQRIGDTAKVFAMNREGATRLVRSFPMAKAERRAIAFAPGKVAERFKEGTATHLEITIGNGKPVRVFTIPNGDIDEMTFNRNGSAFFTSVWDRSLTTEVKERVAFFSTGSEADLRKAPVWVTSPDETYHYAWAADDQSVIAFGENQIGTRTSIWRYRPVAGSQPEMVSRREPSIFWDYAMAPDGKQVVVGAERNLGVTVWKADLRRVLKR
jgi:hypothetical protein